jgi:hypothetical protein
MPTGWVPKTGAPVTFNLREAFIAAILGQPDSWLADWQHLMSDATLNTGNFCENVSFDVPPLEVSDLLGFLPMLGGPLGLAAGAAAGFLQVQERLTAYILARVGSVYCQMSDPEGTHCELILSDRQYDLGIPPWGDNVLALPIPAGTVRLKIHVSVAFTGDPGFIAFVRNPGLVQTGVYGSQLWNNTSPDAFYYYDVPATSTDYWISGWSSNPGRMSVQACGLPGGEPVENVPQIEPVPEDYVAPTTTIYTDVADLGAELDRLERKAELVRDLVVYLVNRLAPPAIIVDATELEADEEIPLLEAKGCIITVSSIPDAVGMSFGDPPSFTGLGRVTFGTTAAWFPSVELVQNPMVLAPLPAYATRIRVQVAPPATATVQLLR